MPEQAPAAKPGNEFLPFVQKRALALRAGDKPPETADAWAARKQEIRKRLLESWGGFPKEPCDLAPQKLGELQRDGYRVEKVIFQTRPGVFMTANAYVPAGEGKHPAVLCVHGHWRGAKQDPVVQSRCLGLVKLGFFVLCVDAFGAGERGIGKALGEYHGEMTAATLWPIGLPLSGLQVYENMRAVDYLQSRPEVDPGKLGLTGASGGGNQTMYAGAFDERFQCVVPVCSVGTYQSYIGAACCMCEVVPDAMTYTEESGLLAMVAPRGLMVINATRDAFQFSVGEAKKSIAQAEVVFKLLAKPANIRHTVFESPHAYSQPMREAMYGWMSLHLKGEGNGDPIPEPEIKTEEPEDLRCYPGESRPDGFVTIPAFAAAEGRRIVERHNAVTHQHPPHWEATAERLLHVLSRGVLGGFPMRTEASVSVSKGGEGVNHTYVIETEPGIHVAVDHQAGKATDRRLAIVLDLKGGEHARQSELATAMAADGWDLMFVDLRATGRYAVPGDIIGSAPDHNSSEWSVWTGRPLLGQWIFDIRRVLDLVSERDPDLFARSTLIGLGTAGLPALGAAIFDRRVARVATVGSLATYVADGRYTAQQLGITPPRILRDVGDIPHLAALVAPRRLIVSGGVTGLGTALDEDTLQSQFASTKKIYDLYEAADRLTVTASPAIQDLVKLLNP